MLYRYSEQVHMYTGATHINKLQVISLKLSAWKHMTDISTHFIITCNIYVKYISPKSTLQDGICKVNNTSSEYKRLIDLKDAYIYTVTDN